MADSLANRTAVTGQRFTFTDDESDAIEALSWQIHGLECLKSPGWRVEVVRKVTALHVVISTALARAERPEPDRSQLPLPLG